VKSFFFDDYFSQERIYIRILERFTYSICKNIFYQSRTLCCTTYWYVTNGHCRHRRIKIKRHKYFISVRITFLRKLNIYLYYFVF
jgi:hypothetical protein